MRSRIIIRRKDGHTVTERADEIYRSGPENPLTDADMSAFLFHQ